jgi:hypothetical protein
MSAVIILSVTHKVTDHQPSSWIAVTSCHYSPLKSSSSAPNCKCTIICSNFQGNNEQKTVCPEFLLHFQEQCKDSVRMSASCQELWRAWQVQSTLAFAPIVLPSISQWQVAPKAGSQSQRLQLFALPQQEWVQTCKPQQGYTHRNNPLSFCDPSKQKLLMAVGNTCWLSWRCRVREWPVHLETHITKHTHTSRTHALPIYISSKIQRQYIISFSACMHLKE